MVQGPKSDTIHKGLKGPLGKSRPYRSSPAAARSKRGAVPSKATASCTDTIRLEMTGMAVVQVSPDLGESPKEVTTERL